MSSTLSRVVKFAGAFLVISVIVGGMEIQTQSTLAKILRWSVQEPWHAGHKLTAAVRGVLEESSAAEEKREKGNEKKRDEEPKKDSKLSLAPQALSGLPSTSAEGKFTLIAQLEDGKRVPLALDRRQVEALAEQPSSFSKVQIAFTLQNGSRYVAEIEKDKLIAALAAPAH